MLQRSCRRLMTGFLLGSVLLATGVIADRVQAQTTANGPYYATPSWDQTLPSATRFVILSNFKSEAVLDRNTGLVWERSPSEIGRTWPLAKFICIDKTVGGQKGWRLPAVAELTSLVDPSVPYPSPTLPPGHPFTNVQLSHYWSASSNAEDPTHAWFMAFGDGGVFHDLKTFTKHVWCVRGGGNADAY